jgi:sortase (surface protein transpeptidase)
MDNTWLYAVGLLALTGSALAMAQAIRHTLSIPAIGVEAAVTKLALRPDSTVEVPTDPDKTGWFRLGPSPGQRGSAVILGHVDSHEGPAVFIMLRYLKAGDRVQVTLANGRVATFVVERKATYPNDEFPAQRVYGSHGRAMLQLVTCGGEYDNDVGYTANVVVYTSLVSIERRQ